MQIKKEVSLTAVSKTEDGSIIMSFEGKINTEDPTKITRYVAGINNQEIYRKNRAQASADRQAFEDALYAEQDAMIAAQEVSE